MAFSLPDLAMNPLVSTADLRNRVLTQVHVAQPSRLRRFN